ncbi:MAG: hypothetical protein ABSH49_04570 [Bryobacteraceae bacterium]|jgi:hypothetical protein
MPYRSVLLLLAAALLAAGRMPAQQTAPAAPARLFYSRAFKGSQPPYFQVSVTKDGDTEYREAVDDDLPVRFKLDENGINAVFGLAEKLGFFNHPLESPVKVAFMGAKTFCYENGPQKTEVKFNYSQDPSAQALQDWFERMAETARYRIDLERTAKYDHLGVFQAVATLEAAMQDNRLVSPQQFLPMLDRVAKNESYMHTARVRAAELAEAIRADNK